MGKLTGFTEFARSSVPYRDPLERLQDYSEIFTTPDEIQHSITSRLGWEISNG